MKDRYIYKVVQNRQIVNLITNTGDRMALTQI